MKEHEIGVSEEGIPCRSPEPDEVVTYVKGWFGEGWGVETALNTEEPADE